MHQLHLERVPHRSPGRLALAMSAVVATVLVVAAGLALLGGISNAPGVVAPPGAATPTPSASASGASLPITSQLICHQAAGGSTNVVATITQVRNDVSACTATATDQRLVGDQSITLNGDYETSGAGSVWGLVEIRNDAGAWAGTFKGTVDTAGNQRVDGLLFGSRGYADLRVRYLGTGNGQLSTMQAVVEPATSIPAYGSTIVYSNTCDQADSGTAQPNGDVVGMVLRCSGDPGDPRLAGTFTGKFDLRWRADGGADMQGTITIANPAGGWSGPMAGLIDGGYTTHHVHAVLAGTGAYAGLTYTMDMIGTSEGLYASTGTITPTTE